MAGINTITITISKLNPYNKIKCLSNWALKNLIICFLRVKGNRILNYVRTNLHQNYLETISESPRDAISLESGR